MGLKKEGSMNYLIYDEIQFMATGDFSVDNEVVTGALKTLKFDMGGFDKRRDMPVFHDDIEIDEGNYRRFWEFLDHYCEQYIPYINRHVLGPGIPLPYWNLEFLTHTTFHPHAMIVVMDLFYNDEDF